MPLAVDFTPSFEELLARSGGSLWVTTYQAGKLILLRSTPEGRVSMLLRSFPAATGLALRNDRVAIGTRRMIWTLRRIPPRPASRHDARFAPHTAHVTGDIRVHELAWCDDELWFVNTRFSCLCTLHEQHSFRPRWRPAFISQLVAEDRCHLNGLAVEHGRARFVTALGASDARRGWRANKAQGGVVIDVAVNTTIATGLSMPHSPRLWQGKLCVLESGEGRLLLVDPRTGERQTIAQLPGYGRGLAIVGGTAWIGLSKFRERRTFGELPLLAKTPQPKCGVWVVDLGSGKTLATLEFPPAIAEVFDVQFLPGVLSPTVVSLKHPPRHGLFDWPTP